MRVTLTYNLYFYENERASAKDLVSELPFVPREANEGKFGSRFADLLRNPKFLPDGGMLGFGLRNVYQVKDELEDVYDQLKGSDAIVYQSLRALGLEPTLYLYYESQEKDDHGVLLARPPSFMCIYEDDEIDEFMRFQGGISISVTWVTPRTDLNNLESPYAQVDYKLRGDLDMMRGELCLALRIGEAGKRLVHSTDAQASDSE